MTPDADRLLAAHSVTTRNVVHEMDALTLLNALPSESVSLVVTSPPYDDLRRYEGYSFPFKWIAIELYRVLKTGGVLVWVVSDATKKGGETLTSFKQAMYFVEIAGFLLHDTMIWRKQKGCNPNVATNQIRYQHGFEFMFILSKNKPSTINLLQEKNIYAGKKKSGHIQRQRNGKLIDYSGDYTIQPYSALSNVWYIPVGHGHSHSEPIAYQHPATFPEELARRHILTWSNQGDLVLDCFMGSGTTARMAQRLGRDYIGCDISAEYVTLARRRLAEPYTLPMFPDDARMVSEAAAGVRQLALMDVA